MKKSILVFATFIACMVLTACNLIGHECTYSDWYVLEETSCAESGIEERICLICSKTDHRTIEKLEHTPENADEKAPTCTVPGHKEGIRCSICFTPISGMEEIPATGHTIVIDEAYEPTDHAPGKTEGKHCSTCGEIIVRQQSVFSGDYSNADRYDGDYAYESLLELENGSSMQAFYNSIDGYADDFHNSSSDAKSKENSETTVYYAAEIDFGEFGLTSEEAITTWSAYRIDHPLYYWIAGNISYTDSYITLLVYDEYADGQLRDAYNDRIYELVQKYVNTIEGESEDYLITLAFHDMIIRSADYLYDSDGKPSTKTSAHNVIGVMLEGAGVCESYTKTFQLLLNYCGIDNIFVSGKTNEAHAWNLVNVDGDWYWYDLTWDDTPEWGVGVRHSYFCVNDTQNVNWQDGAVDTGAHGFLDDHTPYTNVGLDINYTYQLPARDKNVYSYDGELIRDNTIIVGNNHYIINGYNTVSLTKIEAEGNVVIPESINYKGREYKVVSIGIFENGLFKPGNILKYNTTNYSSKITSISIPKTVEFIWDYAFDYSASIKEFIVDRDNQHFASVDGVLFTKSLYTLIKYPMAKYGTSYQIPEETVELAFNAFGDGGSVFCPRYLGFLTLGDNLSVIGACNFGKGYRDAVPKDSSEVIFNDGYMSRMRDMFVVITK